LTEPDRSAVSTLQLLSAKLIRSWFVDAPEIKLASSPASSGSGKRAAERSAGSGDEDDGGGDARKKLRLSKDQNAVLDESFTFS
jgi:hypothetical protein